MMTSMRLNVGLVAGIFELVYRTIFRAPRSFEEARRRYSKGDGTFLTTHGLTYYEFEAIKVVMENDQDMERALVIVRLRAGQDAYDGSVYHEVNMILDRWITKRNQPSTFSERSVR